MTWSNLKHSILAVLGVCGSWIAYMLGGWDTALTTLLIIMVIDYATGVMVAIVGKSGKTDTGGLNSRAGFEGLFKKIAILLAVLLGAALDRALGGTEQARDVVILFFSANEALSVVENFGLLGVPFPEKLLSILEQLKSKEKIK